MGGGIAGETSEDTGGRRNTVGGETSEDRGGRRNKWRDCRRRGWEQEEVARLQKKWVGGRIGGVTAEDRGGSRTYDPRE